MAAILPKEIAQQDSGRTFLNIDSEVLSLPPLDRSGGCSITIVSPEKTLYVYSQEKDGLNWNGSQRLTRGGFALRAELHNINRQYWLVLTDGEPIPPPVEEETTEDDNALDGDSVAEE